MSNIRHERTITTAKIGIKKSETYEPYASTFGSSDKIFVNVEITEGDIKNSTSIISFH